MPPASLGDFASRDHGGIAGEPDESSLSQINTLPSDSVHVARDGQQRVDEMDDVARQVPVRHLRPAGITSFLFPSPANGLERDHWSAGGNVKCRETFASSGRRSLRFLHGAPNQIGNHLT